ncbi:MAG: HU family DNA-binding protein [Oscillospiraceae bacterium]|jgi:DNA-binding protein HU-beta|nr:HU family DNA-binding protein [Oscillospiraceae bacterium]
MNKTELITSVANKAKLTRKDSEKAVVAVIDSIVKAVGKGEKVQLIGFGTFGVRHRSERKGRDPRNNKTITIKASRVPVFKAGKQFKESVSKHK